MSPAWTIWGACEALLPAIASRALMTRLSSAFCNCVGIDQAAPRASGPAQLRSHWFRRASAAGSSFDAPFAILFSLMEGGCRIGSLAAWTWQSWQMSVVVDGERFELLAHISYGIGKNYLESGFEIFARDSRGRYVDQVAMGEAASLDESKALAEAMVRRPRSQWPVLALA